MTQRAVQDLAVAQDKETMLANLKEAEALGMFPQKMNDQQAQLMAYVASAYGLDPFMGEIMPFQGKPYITIAGRRRKDEEAGHFASLRHRPLTTEEKEWYLEADAMKDGDLCGMTVLKDERGNVIEAFWKVTREEREAKTERGSFKSPVVVNNPIEMGQKRGERRAREILWGPIALPKGLDPAIRPLEEGDFVEGEARWVDESQEVSAPPKPSPTQPKAPARPTKPKLGNCEEHEKPWAPGQGGRIGHPMIGGWHWKDVVAGEDDTSDPPLL
jgi:hypothetical protein